MQKLDFNTNINPEMVAQIVTLILGKQRQEDCHGGPQNAILSVLNNTTNSTSTLSVIFTEIKVRKIIFHGKYSYS